MIADKIKKYCRDTDNKQTSPPMPISADLHSLFALCSLTTVSKANVCIDFFYPFIPEFLKWTLISLNLDPSIVTYRGFSQKLITEW